MGQFLATPFFLLRQACLWVESVLTGDTFIVLQLEDPEAAEALMEALGQAIGVDDDER